MHQDCVSAAAPERQKHNVIRDAHPNHHLPEDGPAHLPRTLLPRRSSAPDSRLSRSKRASPRGGGATHPEAALLLPAPTGVQPTLPSGQPLLARWAWPTLRGWNLGQSGVFGEPESPPTPPLRSIHHPTPRASLEWRRPEHLGGPWLILPNSLKSSQGLFLASSKKTGCCSLVKKRCSGQ